MSEFDLDLQSVEEDLDEAESDDTGGSGQIVLGELDGTTDDEEWLTAVDEGKTLVLDVEGDVNERASGFARQISEDGGELMHFRGFLVVTPPGVSIDASRVG